MGAFQIFTQPSQQALDTAANVLSGATLTFSLTGTSTPTNAYSEKTLSTPLANPLSANSAGVFPPIFLDPAIVYRVILKTAAGATLQTWDPANEDVLSSSRIALALDSLKRTVEEIAAGVTPTNYAYAPGVDLRYGVVRDDSTDNQTALTNLIAVGAQGTQIVLTQGVARHSDTLDWSHNTLRVYAEGKSQLRHTGTGVANKIDALASRLEGVIFDGYIEELGNANTTIGWYIRGLCRSRLDLRAKNATTYGCQIQFAVLCDIRFAITDNDGVAITTAPTYGLALMHRDPGEQVAGCRFPNLTLESLPSSTGLLISSCFCCHFIDGTAEGCLVGVEVNGAENNINTFTNFDFEANGTLGADVTVSGGQNLKFINCNSISNTTGPNIDLNGGDSTAFIGGFYRWVDCASGATNTLFLDVQVPDNGSVGITGTGSKKIIGVQKVLPDPGDGHFVPQIPPASGVVYDDIGNTDTYTPTIVGGTTAGTQAYAANSQKGYYNRVGRSVTFSVFLTLTANSGGTGVATISLPFKSQNVTNGYQSIPIGDYTGITLGAAGRTLILSIPPNSTTGFLIETDTGSVSNQIAIGSVSATANIRLSGAYIIDG